MVQLLFSMNVRYEQKQRESYSHDQAFLDETEIYFLINNKRLTNSSQECSPTQN